MPAARTQSIKSWPELPNRRSPGVYFLCSAVIVVLGICPPIICAWLAENSGHWELFERSGSITTAIGLLLASRRYIRHDIFELVTLDANSEQEDKLGEILEDIITAKLGLALSAFGTLVWGWGSYLGWLSFSYLVAWAAFDFPRARRDFLRLRNRQSASTNQAEPPRIAPPRSAE